ncbi:V-type proton ATPase subunit e1-like isoform X1 [Alnus glutinosa]|uniref:V-type proton ATPase subunit e1-like isoform X1 n=1 Tax=Alnus glutinosa TaxID=3517 RepID=UPI002D7829C2|nr:V-type proton ATPase subunit e1-like isoform X1 [Alnus glutinosa]
MGFLGTTLVFAVIGIIASLSSRICCNRGPSTNFFHLTLVNTATVCCWMICFFVVMYILLMLIPAGDAETTVGGYDRLTYKDKGRTVGFPSGPPPTPKLDEIL